MWKSFIEYITSLGRWGWVVLMDVISGSAGAYLDISGKWGFPTWLWLTMLGVAFVIIPFIAFHKIRCERDDIRKRLDDNTVARQIIAVYPISYQFMSAESGLRIRLMPEIHAIPGVRVEDIQLEIKGKRYETDWKPMDEAISGDIGEYIHADIPMMKAGTYQARLIVCIDNKEYPSNPFMVSYPQSNPHMEVYLG